MATTFQGQGSGEEPLIAKDFSSQINRWSHLLDEPSPTHLLRNEQLSSSRAENGLLLRDGRWAAEDRNGRRLGLEWTVLATIGGGAQLPGGEDSKVGVGLGGCGVKPAAVCEGH